MSDPAEKDRLVQGYKEHLATKDCMHFNKGRDHCPFGANCFYKHALPDGTIVPDNVVSLSFVFSRSNFTDFAAGPCD